MAFQGTWIPATVLDLRPGTWGQNPGYGCGCMYIPVYLKLKQQNIAVLLHECIPSHVSRWAHVYIGMCHSHKALWIKLTPMFNMPPCDPPQEEIKKINERVAEKKAAKVGLRVWGTTTMLAIYLSQHGCSDQPQWAIQKRCFCFSLWDPRTTADPYLYSIYICIYNYIYILFYLPPWW